MPVRGRPPAPGGPAPGRAPRPRREWRDVYLAHPYLWAAIPVLFGVAAAAVAVWRRHVFGYVVGVSIAAFGLLIEALNVADAIWGAVHRRRAGRSERADAPPAARPPAR